MTVRQMVLTSEPSTHHLDGKNVKMTVNNFPNITMLQGEKKTGSFVKIVKKRVVV